MKAVSPLLAITDEQIKKKKKKKKERRVVRERQRSKQTP